MSLLKVGDKVKPSKTAIVHSIGFDLKEYMIGTITHKFNNTEKPYVVHWDNGFGTRYSDEDLILLAEEGNAFVSKPWHPHDALIRKWLDNEGSVVEFEAKDGWVPVDLPYWSKSTAYRVTIPNEEAEQLKLQIAELQSRLKELEGEDK
jgi:hypothetical protein